jgi:FtsP/CotA-like multicopper oxidase with cupredoxin domain
MAHHDIYLMIESVPGYSPLAPIRCSRQYGRDCMRNPGHEIGRVTAQEIFSTTFDSVVYHRYHDAMYMNPVTDKLIPSDVNEPPWDRRVPGCVLYADVGDELSIHVRNGDTECHSFHVHGLQYGIDSDGAWPLGVQGHDGRRSDQILPGESWTYRFRATPETVGVWAFHDHFRMVQRWADRGLFGMLVVRDPHALRCEHEIPLIVHELAGDVALEGFESPTLSTGQTYAHTFPTTETNYPYYCKIHGPMMAGNVQVVSGAVATANVVIIDNAFTPPIVQVAPGGTVTWFNSGTHEHIVFAEGGGASSFCLNGRSYVGNTPTIVADAGERLRWYLLNLDLNAVWHNVHTHAARWQIPAPPGGAVDVHPLSPTEGFTIDTVAPRPLLFLPKELEELQEHHPRNACRVGIRGDFLFHCHIEEHMMQGLAGLVRAREQLWVTEKAVKALPFVLPFDGADECSPVDGRRTCQPRQMPEMPGMGEPAAPMPVIFDPAEGIGMTGMAAMPGMGATAGMGAMPDSEAVLATAAEQGAWELAPCDSQTLAVHFALLHTDKLLIFSGSGNDPPRHASHTYGSTLWDYEGGGFASPPISYDMFCCGQATLPNGDVLSAGGTKNYDSPWEGEQEAAVFSAATDTWTNVASMADGRWYPTLVSLADGTVAAFSGTNVAGTGLNIVPEIYDPTSSSWSAAAARINGSWPLYPHLFLLEDGRIFWTGGCLGNPGIGPEILDLGSLSTWSISGLSLPANRDQCASVLLPPAQDQRFMVIGGLGAAGAITNCDIVDLSSGSGAFASTASLHYGRTRLNAVLLPDRTVFVSGGGRQGESDPVLQSEIYDPETGSWSDAATATVPRLYHSVAALLPDGRVATAGSNPNRGDDELRIEIFHPPYLFRGARPFIEKITEQIHYNGHYELKTPQATEIKWVQLIRPMATTHSCDTQQRLIDIAFTRRGFCELRLHITDEPNIAPPGWYMLTIVDGHRIPSVARWVHLS